MWARGRGGSYLRQEHHHHQDLWGVWETQVAPLQFSSDLSSVRTSVQFGPPRSQLLLRLLLKLVSDSNCLENRSRILVILLFINLAADL